MDYWLLRSIVRLEEDVEQSITVCLKCCHLELQWANKWPLWRKESAGIPLKLSERYLCLSWSTSFAEDWVLCVWGVDLIGKLRFGACLCRGSCCWSMRPAGNSMLCLKCLVSKPQARSPAIHFQGEQTRPGLVVPSWPLHSSRSLLIKEGSLGCRTWQCSTLCWD